MLPGKRVVGALVEPKQLILFFIDGLDAPGATIRRRHQGKFAPQFNQIFFQAGCLPGSVVMHSRTKFFHVLLRDDSDILALFVFAPVISVIVPFHDLQEASGKLPVLYSEFAFGNSD